MKSLRASIIETMQSDWEVVTETDDGETWEIGMQKGMLRVDYPNDGNFHSFTALMNGEVIGSGMDSPYKAVEMCQRSFQKTYRHIIDHLIVETSKTYYKVSEDLVQETLNRGGKICFIERDNETNKWHIILEDHVNEFPTMEEG